MEPNTLASVNNVSLFYPKAMQSSISILCSFNTVEFLGYSKPPSYKYYLSRLVAQNACVLRHAGMNEVKKISAFQAHCSREVELWISLGPDFIPLGVPRVS